MRRINSQTKILSTLCILTVIGGVLYIARDVTNNRGADHDIAPPELAASKSEAWTTDRPRVRASVNRDDEAAETSFAVEAPEVVELGWGWSQARAEPIPTVCIEFEARPQVAQTSNITISEVSDSYSLAKEMNISASVSVKTVAYSVDGKAEFAKSSNISSTSVSYLVNAEVLNSATFAGPPPDGPDGESRAVRLTDQAARLARSDIERFQAICGEGYVAATIDGARAYLLSVIKTSSKSEREAMKASVSGEGWGVKVEAAASGGSNAQTNKFERNLSFFQQGGSAAVPEDTKADLPENAAEAIARIKKLATAAAAAGKIFEIQITPYQVLTNFPRGEDLLAEEPEHDEIAALWGSYAQLYADLGDALQNPAEYVVPVQTCADGKCENKMTGLTDANAYRLAEQMQDMTLIALDRIERGATICLELEEDCSFDSTLVRSPYAVRANMPLFGAKAAEGGKPARTVPTIADHTSIHLRDPSIGRCVYGSDTPGCITNSVIHGWAARKGLATAVNSDREALANQVAKCMEDFPAGNAPILLGDADDPDAPTVWYPMGVGALTSRGFECAS